MTGSPAHASVTAMSEENASDGKDSCDEYDSKHGKTTLADTTKPSGLTEAGNKEPSQAVPFKVSGK